MPRSDSRRRRSNVRAFFLLLPLFAVLASACQGILGIEGWTKKTASSADAGGCILASDCTGNQVCLFQTCSEPCAKDKDCSTGEYCLRTNDGSACVSIEQAQCGSQDCPAGTLCRGGHCQATCDAGALCPGGQQCSAGICVSSMAGAGGAGGTTNGGQSSAGEAEAAGEVGTAGAGGSLGEAGAPPVFVDDGTAIGAVDAPCANAGALACAGHAQRGQLLCQSGSWQPNGACTGSTLCDSTPGANAGSCQPIISECKTESAGYRFCRGTETDIRACGVDLVTASVVDSCTFVCSAGTCAGECHPADKQCKAGGLVPQTCSEAGAWQDGTACGYKCDSASGKCLAAGCGDKTKNGDETDTDCGGSCGGCDIGGACKGDGDCIAPASGRCINSKCAMASCSDGVKNGTETDKDCGGSCTQRCAVNQGCAVNGDCLLPDSGHCSATKCIAFTCLDGLKNGTETDKDCGGSCAADCGTGLGCGQDSDCASAACLSTVCVACKPLTKVCSGTSVQSCSSTGTWDTPVACAVPNATANCTGAGVCGIASCNKGFDNCDPSAQNGCETNLNDPAACGTACANRVACSSANATPGCSNGVCKPACSPNYGDCNAGTANDGCERVLNSVSSCGTSCSTIATCSAPMQMCTGGACMPNVPYPLGQASSTGWAAFNPSSDFWYVVPLIVTKDATVQTFQLLGLAAGGSARMGLWLDNGNGRPGAFVAQTAPFSVLAGPSGATPSPVNTVLTGGKTYWVGAKFTGSPQLFQNGSTGAVAYDVGQAFATAPSALNPFPSAAALITDTVFNFYLQVQDVPP